jgi:hypothetical protein
MNSSLPSGTIGLLESLGFDFVKSDARTCKEHWLSQEALPHIELRLDPTEDTTASDIRFAIYFAGASDQRDRSRTAFNTALDTIRNGQPIADITDLLALSETRNQEQGTKNAPP